MREQLVTHNDRIYDGTNPCTSVTIHETANRAVGANAQAHANLQTSGGARQASWHIQVDDTEAIRSYPDTAQCWHAGTDAGNRTSIAIEICVNSDGDYDKAFARAAAVVAGLRKAHNLTRADIHQHNHWSGKNCPTQMRVNDRWQEFLNLTDNQGAAPMATMISPVEGRVSSEWSNSRRNPATGRVTSHAGIDIAAATGTPVVAAFGGRVVSVRTGSYRGDRGLWAGAKSGNHVRIRNTDGAVQYYGHLNSVSVKVGQTVKQGQQVGTVGETGQVTGPHLHFETWSSDNINSHFNPRILFERYGVAPGSAPGLVVVPVASVKPTAKPKPKPAGKPASGNSKSDNIAIQKALTSMGINVGRADGVDGSMMKRGVKEFQRAHGLVADGNWGPRTQAVLDLNKRIQRALKDQGYTKQAIDGYLGNQSKTNIKDFQRRTGLVQDGIAGSITQKRLGI